MSNNLFLQFKRGYQSKHIETIKKIIGNSPLRIYLGKESVSNMTYSSCIENQSKINDSKDFTHVLEVLGLNKDNEKIKQHRKDCNNKPLKEKKSLEAGNNDTIKNYYQKNNIRNSFSPLKLRKHYIRREISPLRNNRRKSSSGEKKIKSQN